MTSADANTDFTTAELEGYLSERLDASVTDVEVLNDGLNLVATVSTADEDRAYVLRRPSKLRDTEPFNDLRAEYELLRRLDPTAVPAPSPVLFCDDESVLGDPFFVYGYLDGSVVPMCSLLPPRFRDERARERVADLVVGTLADLHELDVDRFDDACDRQSPRDQVDRAARRIDHAAGVTGRDVARLREVAAWLRRNAPEEYEPALLHGDYRPGNMLFAGTDRPELAGVIDWETAVIGDPLTELGYVTALWRDDGDPVPSVDGIEERYPDDEGVQRVRELRERGFQPFTTEPGSPSRRELVARYGGKTDRFLEHERFYRAHGVLMLATVWEDLHRHYVEVGQDSSFEPMADYAAAVAERIVSGKHPL